MVMVLILAFNVLVYLLLVAVVIHVAMALAEARWRAARRAPAPGRTDRPALDAARETGPAFPDPKDHRTGALLVVRDLRPEDRLTATGQSVPDVGGRSDPL